MLTGGHGIALIVQGAVRTAAVTGEELTEPGEGAERKTREVIDPAILDGWENDIV